MQKAAAPRQRGNRCILRAREGGRLYEGCAQLEFLRTQELIRRFALPPPGIMLDVGGGTGTYALLFAEQGYEVHLIDLLPKHIEEAQRHSSQSTHPIKTCSVGDARFLDWGEASVDVVLLLGPLYHLVSDEDRTRALKEAWRVLRPEGWLFAAGISRFASTFVGLVYDLFRDAQYAKIAEQGLRDGQHRNPTGIARYFTRAYLHRPDELREELLTAGFYCSGVYGLEGPAGFLEDFAQRWSNSRTRNDIIRVAQMLESESSILGMSMHLLAVGQKRIMSK